VARAVERRFGVGDVLGAILGGHRHRVERRIGQQSVGQRVQSGFARELRLGAPFRLVGQVDVLDPRLGVGGHQRCPQRVGELALLLDGGQHRVAALVEFAEVAEPLLERAKLPVVEAAGDLLAVPRDERHGGAIVEQLHGGGHLRLGYGEFLSETGIYGLDGLACRHAKTLPNASDSASRERLACRSLRGRPGCQPDDRPGGGQSDQEASERRPPVHPGQSILGQQHQRDARHAHQRPRGGRADARGRGRRVPPRQATVLERREQHEGKRHDDREHQLP
jgi:hypothetical protein